MVSFFQRLVSSTPFHVHRKLLLTSGSGDRDPARPPRGTPVGGRLRAGVCEDASPTSPPRPARLPGQPEGGLPLLSGSHARKPAFGPCWPQTPSTSASLSGGKRNPRCSRTWEETVPSAPDGPVRPAASPVPARSPRRPLRTPSRPVTGRTALWCMDFAGVQTHRGGTAGSRPLERHRPISSDTSSQHSWAEGSNSH